MFALQYYLLPFLYSFLEDFTYSVVRSILILGILILGKWILCVWFWRMSWMVILVILIVCLNEYFGFMVSICFCNFRRTFIVKISIVHVTFFRKFLICLNLHFCLLWTNRIRINLWNLRFVFRLERYIFINL